jgi:uncharacterized protein (DUF736 family)
MTTIAKLMKQKDGGFIGILSAISVRARKIALAPVEGDGDKAPIYCVLLEDMEIGAAWSREAKSGNEYHLGQARLPAARSAHLLCPGQRPLSRLYLGMRSAEPPIQEVITLKSRSKSCGLDLT